MPCTRRLRALRENRVFPRSTWSYPPALTHQCCDRTYHSKTHGRCEGFSIIAATRGCNGNNLNKHESWCAFRSESFFAFRTWRMTEWSAGLTVVEPGVQADRLAEVDQARPFSGWRPTTPRSGKRLAYRASRLCRIAHIGHSLRVDRHLDRNPGDPRINRLREPTRNRNAVPRIFLRVILADSCNFVQSSLILKKTLHDHNVCSLSCPRLNQ